MIRTIGLIGILLFVMMGWAAIAWLFISDTVVGVE